jgi:hypothetical protein
MHKEGRSPKCSSRVLTKRERPASVRPGVHVLEREFLQRRGGWVRATDLGLPPFHLCVPAADRAPVLVIGHRHAAFDADPHALGGLRGVRREEALQKRHLESPGYGRQMVLYGTRGDRVTHTRVNAPTGRRHSLDSLIRQKVGTARTTMDASRPRCSAGYTAPVASGQRVTE